MNYMMDKIVLHKNKEEIMKVADELIKDQFGQYNKRLELKAYVRI